MISNQIEFISYDLDTLLSLYPKIPEITKTNLRSMRPYYFQGKLSMRDFAKDSQLNDQCVAFFMKLSLIEAKVSIS